MTLEEQIAQINNPQEFTKLCNMLLAEKYGSGYQIIDGTRADGGNDGYVISEKRIFAMYCPIKPERKTDSDYLKKIRSDMSKAKLLKDSGAYEIENWTFLTPRKLSNDIIVKMKESAKDIGLSAIHQESTFLATELSKNKHLISEFPALHIFDLDSKLEKIMAAFRQKDIKKEQAEEEEINHQNIYKGHPQNIEEMDRVLSLRRGLKDKNTKPELKTIYYKTKDKTVKLNALFGLFDFYDPAEDQADDIIQLCDESIFIAETLEAFSVKAYILAHKGYLVSFKYSMLDMQTTFQIMSDNVIGIQTTTDEFRQGLLDQLMALRKEFISYFREAINIMNAKRDYHMLAAVLILIGNAAGQRALYLKSLNMIERSALEKTMCKRSLHAAKEIYDVFNDELGVANALFNLANQIRFLGEEKEAMGLAKGLLIVANKNNYLRLQQNLKKLIHKLETGEIPNYANGEKRE